MRDYSVILFDLDGTLTDPGVGITSSVAYALEKYGITVSDKSTLYKFIGPPLVDSFSAYYGFDAQKAKEAVEYYREYFREKGIFENVIYPLVPDALCALTKRGKTLIVATSKPTVFATQILEHFDIKKYFAHVCGAELDGTRNAKSEVIEYALHLGGISDKSRVLMVGDRLHDIEGAKKAGLDSCGVLCGYGSREELLDAGATYITDSVASLTNELL